MIPESRDVSFEERSPVNNNYENRNYTHSEGRGNMADTHTFNPLFSKIQSNGMTSTTTINNNNNVIKNNLSIVHTSGGKHIEGDECCNFENNDAHNNHNFLSLNITEASNLSRQQENVRQFIDSIPVQSVLIMFLILDFIFLIVHAASTNNDNDNSSVFLYTFFIIFLSVLSVEVILRFYAFGKYFFYDVYNILDLTIVSLSIVLFVCVHDDAKSASVVSLGRVFRLNKLIIVCVKSISAKRNMSRSLRVKVSGNKRRLVDLEHMFDLDITYITDKIIAMSVPTNNPMQAFYRNPISEVRRFFETYHAGHYRIINLCPEMPYDIGFFGYNVLEICTEDHEPPDMKDLVRIVTDCDGQTNYFSNQL